MYLKRLEILGFKTFARRTVIEFPAGITAVVGPNGSGKSNVTDAIRWVLGEQGFAALRCRKTEDLIFSGGAKRAPMGLAEVSLTMDNSDRTLALPFDEVTLMRRSHRSGENEYFINKSKVRLRDLQEAVAPLGQSYTLVNQGMVDAALSLRPQERRSLFEDAAEISVSVTRQADAERRLKHTESNLGRLYDVMAELEPRLRSLKRQAREAEQVQELEHELQVALQSQLLYQWHQALERVQVGQATLQATEDKVHTTKHQQNSLRATLQSQAAAFEHATDALERHASNLTQAERERDAAEREFAVLEERFKALQQRRNDLAQRVHSRTLDHERLAQAGVVAQTALETVQTLLEIKQTDLAKIEESEQDRLELRQTMQQATQQAQHNHFAATTRLTTAQHDFNQHQHRLETLKSERETVEYALAELIAEFHTVQAKHALAAQRLQTCDSAVQQLQQQEQHARDTVAAARQQRTETETALAQQRRTVDTLQSRLDALRRTVASGTGMFSGVKAALTWAKQQDRTDFALVASIIEVPAELETALEVALGGRLQNIVVPQWDAAEAAIQYLKQANAGRATFLPLDTLRTSRPQAAPVGSGILGSASELVIYQPEYQRIIDYLLGRVLVVEHLATARRVVRDGGTWSIVTICGEQVNAAGAMTGGGTVHESGTLRRERELRELPQQLAQAEELLMYAERDLAAVLATIKATEEHMHQLERERREARTALEIAHDQLSVLSRQLERLSDEQAWHVSRIEGLQTEHLSEHHANYQSLLLQAQSEATLTELALAKARTAASEAQQSSHESEQRLLQARTEVAQQQAAVQTQQQTAKTIQQQMGQLTQELTQLAEQETHIQATYAQLAEQSQQVQALVTKYQATVAAIQAHQAPLLHTRDELKQQLIHHEAAERALAEQLLEAQTKLGRAETQVAQAESRREQIWERAVEAEIEIEALAQQFPKLTEPAPETVETIETLRKRLRRMGTINPLAPQEYAELAERYGFLESQIADVEQAAQRLRDLIAELEEAMNERFAETFSAVAEVFQQTFERLFGGGEAQLLLDQATQGIEIIAKPPGKRRQPLSLLSGGERSLTAVALLMALLQVNPTPFCVMDEVDAALDEANVVRFRELLAELSSRTQFVVVTHNRGTVEVASTLYGVTMQADGASKLLSLRMDDLMEHESGTVTYVSTNL